MAYHVPKDPPTFSLNSLLVLAHPSDVQLILAHLLSEVGLTVGTPGNAAAMVRPVGFLSSDVETFGTFDVHGSRSSRIIAATMGKPCQTGK